MCELENVSKLPIMTPVQWQMVLNEEGTEISVIIFRGHRGYEVIADNVMAYRARDNSVWRLYSLTVIGQGVNNWPLIGFGLGPGPLVLLCSITRTCAVLAPKPSNPESYELLTSELRRIVQVS